MSGITVTAKVMGQSAELHEDLDSDTTVADIQDLMDLEGNYTYNVGGKPATKDTVLADGAYVVFAPSVKGAAPVKKVAPKAKAPVKAIAAKPAKTSTKTATKKK